MKKMILAMIGLFISMSAFADTSNERTVKEIVTVLQSKEISVLLSEKDSVGNIRGIQYQSSGRASFGPSLYELSFESYGGPTPQLCKVSARVNIKTMKVMSLSRPTCH